MGIRYGYLAGHIHYFTKRLALALLRESAFEVEDWRYTNASLSGPGRRLKIRIDALPHRVVFWVNEDFGVRLLGRETLTVLAKPAKR